MPDHDPLFKTLLQAFLGDFLKIVAPDIAAKLALKTPEFLRDEFFTDVVRARRHQADLLARVPWRKPGRAPLLVHVEIQAKARRETAGRLWRYSMHIALVHDQTPLSVLVNLEGGKPGVQQSTWRKIEEGLRLVAFTYLELSLGPSPAREYLTRPKPLAWALAALMRPGEWSRARLKLECLRRIAEAPVDEARKFLLVNCVETYLELVGSEQQEYEKMLQEKPNRTIADIEVTWADKLRAEGRQEGRHEGMRQLLLQLIERRFGSLPPGVRRRLEGLASSEELQRLADRVLTAASLDELGLG